MSLLYLASPIDRDDNPSDSLAEYKNFLTLDLIPNAVVFQPHLAFAMGRGLFPEHFVRQINNYALEKAAALVVVVEENQTSWGVPAEIERAILRGKPVHFVYIGNSMTWSQKYLESEVRTHQYGDISTANRMRSELVFLILESAGIKSTDLESF